MELSGTDATLPPTESPTEIPTRFWGPWSRTWAPWNLSLDVAYSLFFHEVSFEEAKRGNGVHEKDQWWRLIDRAGCCGSPLTGRMQGYKGSVDKLV